MEKIFEKTNSKTDLKTKILTTKLLNDQLALFYLGQEGFLIKFQDKYLMIDAYLSSYVDDHFSSAEFPMVRNYPSPIKAEDLDFVDYVFCTHEHCDHADPDTLSILAKINHKATYIVPAPVMKLLTSCGIPQSAILPAEDGKVLSLNSLIQVKPIPSAHEELHQDTNGNYLEMGYLITLGSHTLYHAGDCCIYNGLIDKIGSCEIAMLPVNGRDYYRRYAHDTIGNMNAKEALELSKQLHTSLFIPMHFDLYSNNGVPAATVADCMERSKCFQPYHIFQPGERYLFA